jgi:hypothetical protein
MDPEWAERISRLGDRIDTENATPDNLEEYVTAKIYEHNYENVTDHELWTVFKEEFENFTASNFKQLRIGTRSKLRTHLLRRGVYVEKYNTKRHLSDVLFSLLQEEEQHVWTNNELADTLVELKPMITLSLQDRLNPTLTGLATTPSRLRTPSPPLRHATTLSSLRQATPSPPLRQASANPSTQTPLLPHAPAPAATTQPASFKVQDLPEDTTSTSNLPKTPTIEPVLPISLAVAIPASAPTAIPASAPAPTTPMVSAPAPAELTPPPTPKIAAALSPATCIPTKPQVQPQTLLTSCRNCQATFTSRNRLHKHLRFDCCSTITKNAIKSTITSTSTTSSHPSLQSFDYVQQQITRHLNNLRLRLQHVYPSNQQPKNTSLSSTSSLSSRATATIFLRACHDPSTRPRTTSQFYKSLYFRLHRNKTLSAKAHPLTSKFKIC